MEVLQEAENIYTSRYLYNILAGKNCKIIHKALLGCYWIHEVKYAINLIKLDLIFLIFFVTLNEKILDSFNVRSKF